MVMEEEIKVGEGIEGDGQDTFCFDYLPSLDHQISLKPICTSMVVHSCELVVSSDILMLPIEVLCLRILPG